MCGITAISRAVGRSSINDPRQFMRLAALAIEPRGRDATGFAWTNSDGKSFYWKTARRAAEATLAAPLDKNMSVVIGHTRFKTQGPATDNRNNHPVIDDGIMLVHNGVIWNDFELYNWLDKDYVPKAEVDSQVIATMLANREAFYATHTTDLLEMLEGDAALAWIETADAETLHLARVSGRPLTLAWTRLGDLVMSSTPETLEALSTWSNVRFRDVWEVPEGRYITVKAGELVDVHEFKPLEPKPKYSWSGSTHGGSTYSGSGFVSKYTPHPTDSLLSHDKPGVVVPFDETSRIQAELDEWWEQQEAEEEAELEARAAAADLAGDGRFCGIDGGTWIPIYDGDEVVDYVVLDENGMFIALANQDDYYATLSDV